METPPPSLPVQEAVTWLGESAMLVPNCSFWGSWWEKEKSQTSATCRLQQSVRVNTDQSNATRVNTDQSNATRVVTYSWQPIKPVLLWLWTVTGLIDTLHRSYIKAFIKKINENLHLAKKSKVGFVIQNTEVKKRQCKVVNPIENYLIYNETINAPKPLLRFNKFFSSPL